MKHTQLAKNDRGQALTEYLILVLLIAVAAITTVQGLGGRVKAKLKVISNQINGVSVEDVR